MSSLDKLIEITNKFNLELEEDAKERRMNIIAQNGNDGLHYENEVPEHYNNDNGTLYKVAEQRGWSSYLFDIVKRLERSEKKGEFTKDLQKSKLVIDLWLSETNNN
tara:strand:+ start:59 stop:376 length:318 start_codon:yes stop_codon:yes gene_type:complete